MVEEEKNSANGLFKLRRAKQLGFSDRQLAHLTKSTEADLRSDRIRQGVLPTYRLVDKCAAEFEAYTPYYYSTYRQEDENSDGERKKNIILRRGPNRVG